MVSNCIWKEKKVMAKTPAWQRKEGKSKSGGLNRKGINFI